MSSRSMSLRIDHDLKDKLTEKARRDERPVNFLINAAIKRMLADDDFVWSKINEGLADEAAGRITSHKDVMAEGNAIIARALKNQSVK
jgi:predicted transcriptional regulator